MSHLDILSLNTNKSSDYAYIFFHTDNTFRACQNAPSVWKYCQPPGGNYLVVLSVSFVAIKMTRNVQNLKKQQKTDKAEPLEQLAVCVPSLSTSKMHAYNFP